MTKISLTLQMVLATFLGVLSGILFGDLNKVFSPWGSAYIMLMKVTAIPYLVGAIMHGIGQLSHAQAKEILRKGTLFIGLAWAINIGIIYLIVFLFPSTKGVVSNGFFAKEQTSINFAELLIPENIFYALSNNILPAVVIFSLFIGLSLMHLKEKGAVMHVLDAMVESLSCITRWISRITPFGTFLIIANLIGTIQLATIQQVSTYIILYILGICLIVFWIFPRLTSTLTTIPALKWLKDLFPILLLGYTTNAVIVCLPYIIQLVQNESLLLYPKDEKAQTQTQGIVSILFNLPLGSLFLTVFIFFISIFYASPLSFSGQIELFSTTFLTSLGAVGLGSWINSLNFLLDSLGLPQEGINLYLLAIPFTAGFQSMISVMEIASLSLFITLACRHHLLFKWHRIAKSCLITALPIFLLVAGIKWINPFPKIQNQATTIYDCNIHTDVVMHLVPAPSATSPSGDIFERILKTRTLRVGYHPQIPPFCFYNNHENIVGYDIAFAYELARDLGCHLELVPMNYGNLAEELDAGFYDIAMSAVSINEERLKKVYFTRPYIDAKIVFIAKDTQRKEFSSVQAILAHSSVKISVLKGSSFEKLARQLFPNKEIVQLESYESFAQTAQPSLLLWEEQEAISWVLHHRHFYVIVPDYPLGTDSLGYAMKANSPRFLNFMNQWLTLKENEGFTKSQYNLWILGKTEELLPEEKRWSVIRDVLHWVD